jgi:hypothetical protein
MKSVNNPNEIHISPTGIHKGHIGHPVGTPWISLGTKQEHHKAHVCNSWATRINQMQNPWTSVYRSEPTEKVQRCIDKRAETKKA